MAQNQAAYLDKTGSPLRVASAPMPEPEANDFIIKNGAIAINPVDWKIQDSGFYVQNWPVVLGSDVAGEVVSVGSEVKGFERGDRVAAHSISLMTGNNTHGGFQNYTSVQAAKAAKIPSGTSFASAAVIPLALDTAAVGLYTATEKGGLGLEYPSLEPKDSGKVVFIWGGSSSVGAIATQLAVASGAKVVTTASEHNFGFCKANGASEVIDYRSTSVVEDTIKAIKSLGGTYAGTYDSISLPDQSYGPILKIIAQLGGGSLAVTLPPPKDLPENVKTLQIFGIGEMTHQIWRDWVPKALETGLLKCLPEPLVVGKGLEYVQKGLDENKKGVSAKKVVVEP